VQGLERVVKDSKPPVPEDHEWRERNRLLAEGQKQKKDAAKRKCGETIHMREALEKHRRQQEHGGLPQEESPSEPDSDDGDFDMFSDEEEEQGFRGLVPPQGAPTGEPQGSLVPLKERVGAWPLGPSEMMVLQGALPRRRGPIGTGGADAPERR
jgi:hypothetical protein